MFKKICLIFAFISFFFINSPLISAQTPPNNDTNNSTEETTDQPSWLESVWNAIVSFFNFLIFGTSYISGDDQNVPVTIDTNLTASDYGSTANFINSRAMPESVRVQRKGIYFYEVLTTNKYENKIIKADTSSTECPYDISVSDIVCFYYQQSQSKKSSEKILYTRENPKIPIDYQPNTWKYQCSELKNPNNCYINAYRNYPEVPQGVFQNQKDAAAIASTQLNDSIRTIMPAKSQGEDAPTSNDTSQQAQELVKDSDKQEQNMLLNIIPDKNQDQINCNNKAQLNRENLRSSFGCQLLPNGQGGPECDTNGITLDITNIPCGDKVAKNGPGLSQVGAHGMALSGIKYLDIIKSYYGNHFGSEITTTIKKGTDEKEVTVVMLDDTDFNNDGQSDNDANCTALLRRGLASSLNKVDLINGRGGVNEKGEPCHNYVALTPEEQENSNGNKYRLSNKCFMTITLNVHNYLLGVAEVSSNWHIEALKAIFIAARHTAIQNSQAKGFLWNSSLDQVFQCSEAISNLGEPKNNQAAAIELTRDEMMVKKSDGSIVYGTFRSAFCGPGSYNPNFDGFKYEKISYAYTQQANGKPINGICFEGIGYTLPYTKDIALTSDSTYLQAYENNQNTQVLGQNDQDTPCLLDQRLFSSLDQLLSDFKSQNPNNQLNFISCYRSTQEQTDLWQQYLSTNNGDEFKTISQINYPGTSPHQTGKAIDFADKFGKLSADSSAYQWLVTNASRYGFYHHQLEPEHWEYKP